MPYQLRPLRVEDLLAVTQISTAGGYSNWNEVTFESCFKENYRAWVLVNDEEIMGFLVFLMNLDEIEILNIGVLAKDQRKGLAAYLIKQLLEFSAENKMKQIFLEVNQSNLPAIQLYGKQGFQQVGYRKNYYSKEDALVLSRNLA